MWEELRVNVWALQYDFAITECSLVTRVTVIVFRTKESTAT